MDRLLKIGEFARLVNTTVKTLRFYDEQELLRPAHVDSRSSFRYYTLDQVETFAVIANLRSAGFSIAEIADLSGSFDDAEALVQAFRGKSTELQAEAEALQRRADVLAALSRGVRAREINLAIRLTTVAPPRVCSESGRARILSGETAALFERAERRAAASTLRSPAPPLLVFHDPPRRDARLRLEACVPITGNPGIPLQATRLSGCDLACSLFYTGAYEQTESKYHEMQDWITRAGLRPAGALREVFHRFGAHEDGYEVPPGFKVTNRRHFLTELQLPVGT